MVKTRKYWVIRFPSKVIDGEFIYLKCRQKGQFSTHIDVDKATKFGSYATAESKQRLFGNSAQVVDSNTLLVESILGS